MKKIKTGFEDYYPFNILKDLSFDEEEIRKYSYDSIISVLQKGLTEREQLVLQLRYEKGLTLDACGNEIGVQRERARQIICKALRKLKNPKYIKRMKPCSYEEREELINEIIKLQLKTTPFLKEKATFIESLDLSVRSYNCLRRADIETVQDILDYLDRDGTLRHIRNLGRKSIKEIYNKLSDLGFELDTDKDIR